MPKKINWLVAVSRKEYGKEFRYEEFSYGSYKDAVKRAKAIRFKHDREEKKNGRDDNLGYDICIRTDDFF